MRITFLVAAIMVGLSFNAEALTADQREILRLTLAADGYLDQDMHRKFWNDVSEETIDDPGELAILRDHARSIGTQGIRWQREAWKSIRLSLEAGKVVKSSDYETVKLEFVEFALGIGAPADVIEQGVSDAEGMLLAASEGRSYFSPAGEIELDAGAVSLVLANMEVIFTRFDKLLNPVWQD